MDQASLISLECLETTPLRKTYCSYSVASDFNKFEAGTHLLHRHKGRIRRTGCLAEVFGTETPQHSVRIVDLVTLAFS